MPKLEIQGATMDFASVRALDDVTISFEPGEVHGIVGENGAGKSTLMKILGGILRPTSGLVLLDGRPVSLQGVRSAIGNGIAMIHQELNLVDELTVAENVFLGRELTVAGRLNRAQMVRDTEAQLQRIRAGFPATERVGNLSIAGRQLVEIAKAVSVNASILIMDEPTAVLSDPESQALFALIQSLKAQGTTVLFISHRLEEVCTICDRITVLRDGAKVATMSVEEATPASLADLMVGRPLKDFYPPKALVPEGGPLLQVECPDGGGFSVRPGEIVGLAGLVGSGRTELAEAIVGLRPPNGMLIHIGSLPRRFRSPKQAMRHGVAYVSEDRKRAGLHLTLSIIWNLTLANLRQYGKLVPNRKLEETAANRWQQDLDIRASDLHSPVEELSGGNQQKVAIAKWLDTAPELLILDEPTRGVDVGAKLEIYEFVQRLAATGMACLVISSELPEVIGLCHRAVVMREGRVVGEVAEPALTEAAVMRLAAGVGAA